jgi:hypothetical protein
MCSYKRRKVLASAEVVLFVLVVTANCLGHAQATSVTVNTRQSGKAISPNLVGVFFEDLNYAADGGLYAELIQNRSFEYSWGSKRAAAGHAEPFGLKYLGLGNEDAITPVFKVRFRMIYESLKTRHPEISVIGTVPR